MALPGTSTTILDGGLGVTAPATSTPHVIGVFESGPMDTPTTVANLRVLRETFGVHGQGNDLAGYILAQSGGPIIVTRVDPSVAGTYSAPGGTGSTSYETTEGGATDNEIEFVVATSEPKNDFDIQIVIDVGGARTATKFRYSLDGGNTFSGQLTAAASVALGTSGVTAEFQAGAVNPFVAGTVYEAESRGPFYNATDLGDAFDAIESSTLKFDFVALAGEGPTASGQATLFSTFSTRLAALLTSFEKYVGGMMNAGDDVPADVLTAFPGSLTQSRISVAYSWFRAAPAFSITGRGLPRQLAVNREAQLAAGNLMSTDLAQTFGAASIGAIPGATEIGHDEFLEEAGLDAAKISTLRTYSNLDGFYLTNAHMKSPSGSDFEFWQHRRIMDEACKAVSRKHAQLISSMVVVKTDGTGSLTEASAQDIEKFVQRELDNVIGSATRKVGPVAIDGKPGHVSDIAYQVDRTNNVLSTKQLIATVSIVPRGYLKTLSATISFALSI